MDFQSIKNAHSKEGDDMTTATPLKKADFGILGIAVMGENLAMNIEDHGFSVAVCNLRSDRVTPFMKKNEGKKFIGTRTL